MIKLKLHFLTIFEISFVKATEIIVKFGNV